MPRKKIIVRIIGGLGNQLFGYAAARRLATKNNAELVIDNVSGFKYDIEYGRKYELDHFEIAARKATKAERLEPFSRIRRFLKRKFNNMFPYEQRNFITQNGVDFDERLLRLDTRKNFYLEGYWQSENYFLDVSDEIKRELTIKPPSDNRNKSRAARMRKMTSVAVHVRFFDAPDQQGENATPTKYYETAIEIMENEFSNAHYFIFSDFPDSAREFIKLSENRVTIINHNSEAYADLWLMTQCKHFIIGNSTFSWWGAWLAKNSTKKIIAPGFEKRDGAMWWGFEGLIPDRWIKID